MTPRECRPPEGTPDGTVCWLQQLNRAGRHYTYAAWNWRGWGWEHFGSTEIWSPLEMANYRWRFHSIAEPPHE